MTGEDLLRLLRRSHEVAPDRFLALVTETVEAAGGRDVEWLLVDHELRNLVTTSPESDEDAVGTPIEDTVVGDVFTMQEMRTDPAPGGGERVWVPITEIADRLGVLGLTVDSCDDDVRRWCLDLATLVASLLQVRQRYTDGYARIRRLRPMTLPAELQWGQLPPLNFAAPGVTLSGLLEPAYHIGGDAFDYALNGSTLHFGLFDAMGHGLDAASIAGVAVGCYRNQRRSRASLPRTVMAMDSAVLAQFGGDRFATAQIGELDVETGECRWLSAGHPPPLRIRGESVERLPGRAPRVPIGIGGDEAEVASVGLEPGDRLFFYSDGITEARDPVGEHYGEGRVRACLVQNASQLPGEQLRRLVASVMDHQEGVLRDDATVLCLEWLGPPSSG